MLSYNKRKGNYGETAAAGFLEAKGYVILERNYKRGSGEIDMIARDNDCIVFVEVKYRKTLSAGLPREAVTAAKQRIIKKTANYYIFEKQITNTDMRFDVVEVVGSEQLEIEHLDNAFW